MIFLPKELEEIITDYKNQMEKYGKMKYIFNDIKNKNHINYNTLYTYESSPGVYGRTLYIRNHKIKNRAGALIEEHVFGGNYIRFDYYKKPTNKRLNKRLKKRIKKCIFYYYENQ